MADLELPNANKNQNQSGSGDNAGSGGEAGGGSRISQMQSDNSSSSNSTQQQNQQQNEAPPEIADIDVEDVAAEIRNDNQTSRGENLSDTFSKILESKQGKTYTTAILSAVLVAVMFFFAITPALSSISRQLEENAELRDRIGQMETKQQNLNTLLSKSNNNAQAIEQFRGIIGNDRNETDDYEEITAILDRNDLQMRSVIFSDGPTEIPKYDEIVLPIKLRTTNIRVIALGSLDDMNSAVADFEENERLFEINEINASIPEDIDDTNDYQAEFNLRTIYWSQFGEDEL
jgi:hypothetical protein